MEDQDLNFMQEAISLAARNLDLGEGGPFGAVVVREGRVVGRGWNQVLASNDPTAHAEINAIRDACRNLKTFQLSDCTIYSSCEPCPMCLGAIYWARPVRVVFACTREDAAGIGFDDAFIYRELELPLPQRHIAMQQLGREQALALFAAWKVKEGKVSY